MRVLVTGAAGRIGRTLAAGLTGHRLRLTDLAAPEERPADAEFVAADLTEPGSAAALVEGMDAVIHMAGHPNSRDWAVVERLNVGVTRTLLEAAAAAGVRRAIVASSVHVAGHYPGDARLTEAMPLRPDGPYGLSKAANELTLRYLCERHGITGFALRICAFQPRPVDARQLRLWLSPADMVRLAAACLTADVAGYRAVWGLSNNARADVDRAGWDAIGYRPRDDAEQHAGRLAADGIDVTRVSEWPLLGGSFAA